MRSSRKQERVRALALRQGQSGELRGGAVAPRRMPAGSFMDYTDDSCMND